MVQTTLANQHIVVEFEHERSSRNTYRYKETSAIPHIGTLYVQKFALGEKPPMHIRVTVEVI